MKETIQLTEHEAEFIRQTIASGLYADINEMVRAGLLLLEEEQEKERAAKEKLREMLIEAERSGISDLTPREAMDAGLARYRERR